MSEAQREFIRASFRGEVCWDCGEPIERDEPCSACAVKAIIVAALLDDQEIDA